MFSPENINWYKQSAAIKMLTISMPYLAIKKRMESTSGFVFSNNVVIAINDGDRVIFGHYFDYDLNIKQAKKIITTMDSNPDHFKTLADKFYMGGKAMEQAGKVLVQHKTIDNDFWRLYNIFIEQNYVFWENSLYLDLLDPVEEMVLADIFGDQINSLSKKDINLLLSPKDASNLQKEQSDMLQIFEQVQAGTLSGESLDDALEKHSQKYYWIKNDYEKTIYLDASYFRGVLDTWLANTILAEEVRSAIEKTRSVAKAKADLVQSLGLNENVKTKLELLNLFTNLRDDRKKYNCMGNYYLMVAAEYVARELDEELDTILWAQPLELPSLLRDPELLEELKKRRQYGCIAYSEGGELFFETGPEVMEMYERFETGLQKTEIRGNIASPGKAIGTARIVLSQADFSKMKQDDVLVAAMTRPEYLSIMKMASAIITDEGGITCHAAIVARELGIPCIIGTQVATKAIKDGDKVEVNANHGTVIKL